VDNRLNKKDSEMGKFDGWLLASDMDGTLLSPDGNISDRNRRVIGSFVAQGGRFTIATGRMPTSILERIHGLAVNCPMIVLNGAGLYDLDSRQWLNTQYMRMDVLHACVADVARAFPDIGIIAFEPEHAAVLSHVPWLSEMTAGERARFVETAAEQVGADVFKLVLTGQPARIDALAPYLAAHPVAPLVDMLLTADSCLELMPPGISKGTALIELRDSLGIAPEKVLAIGDYENDAAMLRVAGISAAPENAHPDVRALADHIVAHHGEDAVADFLYLVFGREWFDA
jgi:hypothetical protein